MTTMFSEYKDMYQLFYKAREDVLLGKGSDALNYFQRTFTMPDGQLYSPELVEASVPIFTTVRDALDARKASMRIRTR